MDWLILNSFCKLVTWSMASGQQKRRGVDPNLSWRAGSITIRETSETVCQSECLSHCGSLYSALSPLHCLKFLLLWALVICKLVHNSFVCSVAPPAFFSYIFSARLLIQLLPYFQWFSRPTSCVFEAPLSSPHHWRHCVRWLLLSVFRCGGKKNKYI